ncbi:hypothetical protein EOD42_14350 [Rhodovarius crocodyli]|uniref:Uncharacterized protein n=1 Tax=Rhodovarius crocodyli TaxID=1979269 RepID=A0A437MF48_9PROT|nr:hypothetical protein [Rhodovarius crocodyli]RVT96288.1 hypothetical protein EOD42_14350 [Rhodovarius crocodyli]
MPIAKRCRKCTGSNCGAEATANWDVESQSWVLGTLHTNTWCDACEYDDPGLVDVEVSENLVEDFQLEIWRGDDNEGPITRIVVACVLFDPEEAGISCPKHVFEEEADITRLLTIARQSERSDPFDDKLPSDEAIITAALNL